MVLLKCAQEKRNKRAKPNKYHPWKLSVFVCVCVQLGNTNNLSNGMTCTKHVPAERVARSPAVNAMNRSTQHTKHNAILQHFVRHLSFHGARSHQYSRISNNYQKKLNGLGYVCHLPASLVCETQQQIPLLPVCSCCGKVAGGTKSPWGRCSPARVRRSRAWPP